MRIGVLGCGHLGKIHIQQILELKQWELVGFYDPNPEVAKIVSDKFGVKNFSNIDELVDACDAIDIVTPTLSHYDCAKKAIRKSKHVFIEKPITNTVSEAKELIELAKEAGVKVQVGHVERFNPAFRAVVDKITAPKFIETHRLAEFNPRGTDVSVVLDLMIHDLDIILSVVKSTVRRVSASGVAVLSDSPDIANARIEFNNGCVANVTASRISLKNMRKSRFFQQDAYISVDFLEKKAESVSMKDIDENTSEFSITLDPGGNKKPKEILFDQPDVEPRNAIRDELDSFFEAIASNKRPVVSIEDGTNALELAHTILEKMDANAKIIANQE
ncbi:Gfo/Idh/MocA family protein [Luteibaculum oceani]|uniref:Gfo/Idh/MocA family oxidoreductase n=1 Tax=Luteibaculum oceani TaxID=1294296 RepID=A0A5C6VA33_9FLAO|nr:Gfo/Idh/MocA family oxidoreductase [Luteibaculum oceani]TXC82049.1 Gfo/Idh/MocA family oxidoreductase [Luteibaculum oceani]